MRKVHLLFACLAASTACFRMTPRAHATGGESVEPQPRVETPTAPAAAPPRVTRLDDTGAGSSVLLARVDDQLVAYVADADDARVRAFDAETFAELGQLDPGGAPAQLAMDKDGRLFASLRDRNQVVAITGAGTDAFPFAVVARADVATEPVGLTLSPDGASLLVASGWGHALTGLALHDGKLVKAFELDLGREPRAVVTSDDGKRAFVSHAIGADVDVVELPAGRLAKGASLNATQFLSQGRFPLGEFKLRSSQGFALARSVTPAGRVFVPHARVRPALVASMMEEGTAGYGSTGAGIGPTEQFSVAVLDEDTGRPLPRSLDTESGTTCVLPRAIATTRDGELLVVCLGTSELKSFDAAAVNPHEALVRSWPVPEGPTGVAVDDAGARAVVWSQFAHAITSVALASESSLVLASKKVERAVPSSAALERGRVLFHSVDPRISEDGRACASCHPDGRDDGLVWQTPDGPRNPPMLAGRVDRAAPYGWLGESEDIPHHLKKTFARLGGRGLGKDDVDALVAYVKAMPVPHASSHADGASEPDALVAEGRRLYESDAVGCASCHGEDGVVPDTFTHNVQSWAQGDRRGVFDTPSLRFLGGTAPYFHDGRYPSLTALLSSTKKTMGHTAQLTDQERGALEAYLRTL
jgi:mono/diheme cytochrome c family protein